MTTTAQPVPASPRALWALHAAAFLLCADVTLLNIALPSVSREFNESLSVSSRAVMAYILALSCLGPVAGRLADRWGIRRLLSLGYGLFGAFSVLCAFSPGIGMLIAMRAGQGAGGALLYVLGPAAVARWTPEERRGRVLGIMGAAAMAGIAFGPSIGGFITQRLGWRWIFGVNAPLALAGVALTARCCPRDTPAAAAPPLDWPGALAGLFVLLPLISALNLGQEAGWLSTPIVACFAAAAVFMALFIRRELRAPSPVIDLAMLRGRATGFGLAATMLWLIVFGGLSLLIPFHAQCVLSLKPEPAGYLVMAYAGAVGVFTVLGGRLADAVSARAVCAGGLAAMLPGLAGMTTVAPSTPPLHAAAWMVLIGLGNGLFTSAAMVLVLRHVNAGQEGATSGLFSAVKSIAQLLGVAIFETLLSQASGAGGGVLMTHAADPKALAASFRHVFALAGALCAAAMVCAALTGPGAPPRQPASKSPALDP